MADAPNDSRQGVAGAPTVDTSVPKSADQLTPEQEAARDKKLAEKGFTRDDIHVFVDEKGNRLANAEKFAGKEFQAEDAKLTKAQHAVLPNKLRELATALIAGKDVDPKGVAKKLDAIATVLELAPEGIRFSAQGRPDLTPFAREQVKVDGLTGHDRDADAKMANKAAGISEAQWEILSKAYVWHHVEDGKTMQLVPKEIHDLAKHYGGAYAVKHGPEAALTPASEQIMREAYAKQAEMLSPQQKELAEKQEAQKLAAERELAAKAEQAKKDSIHIDRNAATTKLSAIEDKGRLENQKLTNADGKKVALAELVKDPVVATINGHERKRFEAIYDKAKEKALERGASEENAIKAAQDKLYHVTTRLETVQARAKLKEKPYTENVYRHFKAVAQLRTERVEDLQTQARRECITYKGPTPKSPELREVERKTVTHEFTMRATQDIDAKRYGWSDTERKERRDVLDEKLAKRRTDDLHEYQQRTLSVDIAPTVGSRRSLSR